MKLALIVFVFLGLLFCLINSMGTIDPEITNSPWPRTKASTETTLEDGHLISWPSFLFFIVVPSAGVVLLLMKLINKRMSRRDQGDLGHLMERPTPRPDFRR